VDLRPLVAAALAREEAAVAELVRRLTPVIQARVARVVLARGAGAGPAGIHAQVEDLTQEVFLTLFAEHARVLASWQPERGLSLENFVGLVARRRALSILRSGRGAGWRGDPALDGQREAADDAAPAPGPEARTVSRQELSRLLARLRQELSPLGWHLFDLLFLREHRIEEAGAATGLSRDALYAWRSRLKRLARRLAAEGVPDFR
jgi:RNA polymerase sigma-70 factor (ECF subfamily)